MIKHPAPSSNFKRALIAISLAVSSVAASSCLPFRPSPECRAFYDLSPQQREAKVRASPVEKQLDLYWCGMFQEPPTDFADDIADGGAKIIPFLLERLKVEESETDQDLIIHIFERLAIKGHLRGREDVAVQLRQVVSTMKNESIRSESQQRLQVVEGSV